MNATAGIRTQLYLPGIDSASGMYTDIPQGQIDLYLDSTRSTTCILVHRLLGRTVNRLAVQSALDCGFDLTCARQRERVRSHKQSLYQTLPYSSRLDYSLSLAATRFPLADYSLLGIGFYITQGCNAPHHQVG